MGLHCDINIGQYVLIGISYKHKVVTFSAVVVVWGPRHIYLQIKKDWKQGERLK